MYVYIISNTSKSTIILSYSDRSELKFESESKFKI